MSHKHFGGMVPCIHCAQEIERLRNALKVFADFPLEAFGHEERDKDYPLFGANGWQLTVGHVRHAREVLA